MNEMIKNAVANLANTAGRYNDAKRTGNRDGMNIFNQMYSEKAALLRDMGFTVETPETDEYNYVVAVTVNGERAKVSGLFR